MKFDKARVYTALNADELEIGSICFLADTIAQLRERVESENDEYKRKIDHIFSERVAYRFCDKSALHFLYAYLIEPPRKPNYRPFKNVAEAMTAIKEHGGWVQNCSSGNQYIVLAKFYDSLLFWRERVSMKAFLQEYVFADDGSPCGKVAPEVLPEYE